MSANPSTSARIARCRLCMCPLGPREPLERHLLLESCIEAQAARIAALEYHCSNCGNPLDLVAGPPQSRLCGACRHRKKWPESTPRAHERKGA